MQTSGAAVVARRDLRVGSLLAEGGEGRVFELPTQPHLVFKAYRNPVARRMLDDLVAWPGLVAASNPSLVARVRASTAWPTAVVVEPGHGGMVGSGLLIPRAPRRFAVRHRDGSTRLATLSYLTADPGQRAAAYGLALPGRAGAERIGLVYALARLLEAFESAEPAIGHGDLSTKNVLWSLLRGPEVFVIDCDNCERYSPLGEALGPPGRRRAMTPNWEDPAIASGENPTPASDRYSLALTFLRVVGAAHFPLQRRQKQGEVVHVDFGVPPALRRVRSLEPGAPIWRLCERGLSLETSARPPASAWVAELEAVLVDMGARGVLSTVWANQGGGAPAGRRPDPGPPVPDVTIRPVFAEPRTERWQRLVLPDPAALRPREPSFYPFGPRGGPPAPGARLAGRPGGQSSTAAPPPDPLWPQVGAAFREGARWWAERHARALRSLRHPDKEHGAIRLLAFCAAVDVALAVVGFFLVAMIVSPILGL